MFTGIIEEIGTVKAIQKKKQSAELILYANLVLQGLKLGDSIAVNGICLTVTHFTSEYFSVDVMPETLSRTSLSTLKCGSHVNLERAMEAGDRFGGHMVTGHIDGVGTITSIQKEGIATWYTIKTSPAIMKYIIEKGSIAIDGISLTVAKFTEDTFSVSVIPHTLKHTILPSKSANDLVNLENDCLGKYVEKLLHTEQKETATMTRAFLAKYGY